MNEAKLSNINYFFYAFLFLITATRVYAGDFFITGQSILSWPNISYIPLIESINAAESSRDSFVQSATNSPNIVFAYFIKFFSLFGLDSFEALLLLKLIYIFFIPILVMSLFFRFCEEVSYTQKYSQDILYVQKLFIFIGILALSNFSYLFLVLSKTLDFFGFYNLNLSSFFMPFGWDDPMNHQFIAPSTLSFFTGVMFNTICLGDKEKNSFLAYLILFITTLIHPVVGIGNFIIGFILSATLSFSKTTLYNFAKYFFLGILFPIIVLLTFFGGLNDVDVNDFVDTYVYLRHPHHYLMSEAIGLGSFFWLVILILNFTYALKTKSKPLVILNSFSLIFLIISVLAQFIGTEVVISRRIIELGPSRFSQYIFMLCLICFISNIAFHLNRKKISFKNIFQKMPFKNLSLKNYLILCLIIFLPSFIYFNSSQFDEFNRKNKELTDWIARETSPESVFFIPESANDLGSYPVSFLVRIFSQRIIWVDHAYPFNHSSSKEWGRRFKVYKEFNIKTLPSNIVCDDFSSVDYIILSSSSDDLGYEHVFESMYWKVFNINPVKQRLCL